jgi:LuxR family transcriptional regulator
MNLRKYLKVISYSKSLEELWAVHTEKMASYGFDRLLYGYTRFRTEKSLGDPEDFVVLSNHDPAYVSGFIHSGLYFHAPLMNWALENEGAISWRAIADTLSDGPPKPEMMRVHEFNLKHDVTVGYTVTFTSLSARSKGAISMAAKRGITQDEIDAVWEEHGEDILLMNNVAHLKILTMPYVPPNRGLTKRQREALEWVGDGKTTQDIATLMGLTPATVEKHLRLAREALAVETTAQAVLKAALHNQMFVLEA